MDSDQEDPFMMSCYTQPPSLTKITKKVPRGFTQATCLDIENAFDKLWLEGLTYKISQLDLPMKIQ